MPTIVTGNEASDPFSAIISAFESQLKPTSRMLPASFKSLTYASPTRARFLLGYYSFDLVIDIYRWRSDEPKVINIEASYRPSSGLLKIGRRWRQIVTRQIVGEPDRLIVPTFLSNLKMELWQQSDVDRVVFKGRHF